MVCGGGGVLNPEEIPQVEVRFTRIAWIPLGILSFAVVASLAWILWRIPTDPLDYLMPLAYLAFFLVQAFQSWRDLLKGLPLGRGGGIGVQPFRVHPRAEGQCRWFDGAGRELEMESAEAWTWWLRVLRTSGLPVKNIRRLPWEIDFGSAGEGPEAARRYPWCAPGNRTPMSGPFPDRPVARDPLLAVFAIVLCVPVVGAALVIPWNFGMEVSGVILAALLFSIGFAGLLLGAVILRAFGARRILRIEWSRDGLWVLHRVNGESFKWDPSTDLPRELKGALKGLASLGLSLELTEEQTPWMLLVDDVEAVRRRRLEHHP